MKHHHLWLNSLQATINEVLRISRTAPGSLMHVAMEDVHVNGYTLPKVDNGMDVVDVDHDYHVHINDDNTLQNLLLWKIFTSQVAAD